MPVSMLDAITVWKVKEMVEKGNKSVLFVGLVLLNGQKCFEWEEEEWQSDFIIVFIIGDLLRVEDNVYDRE